MGRWTLNRESEQHLSEAHAARFEGVSYLPFIEFRADHTFEIGSLMRAVEPVELPDASDDVETYDTDDADGDETYEADEFDSPPDESEVEIIKTSAVESTEAMIESDAEPFDTVRGVWNVSRQGGAWRLYLYDSATNRAIEAELVGLYPSFEIRLVLEDSIFNVPLTFVKVH